MCTYRQKIHFINSTVFEILKFKNSAIWLAKSIFAFANKTWESTWEWNFYQTCAFNRIIKVIRLHDLGQKNLCINELFFFFCKILKTLFLGYFWALSPNWDFPPKIQLYQFLSLRHRKFMRSFNKILWATLEKKSLPTDLLTY